MRPGSGGSDGRPASDGSSRSSGRSGISRDEAKSLNASKGLKLASFRAGDNGGEGETEYGYDMGVVGTIDPLATRKGPSAQNTGGLPSGGNTGMGTSPSLVGPSSRGSGMAAAPPRATNAVQRAVAAAATSPPGVRAPTLPSYQAGVGVARGSPRVGGIGIPGPPRGGPTRGLPGQLGPPPSGVQPPPPRGGPRGPPVGRPPPSARAPPRGPRPPPRGPLARPPAAE